MSQPKKANPKEKQMLINGDLVRVRQGSVITIEGQGEAISVVLEPEYAVVVDNKPNKGRDDSSVIILINNKIAQVEKRNVSLVGG